MNSSNRLLYTSGVFKKVVFAALGLSVLVVIYLLVSTSGNQLQIDDKTSIGDTTKYTPMPTPPPIPVRTVAPIPEGYVQVNGEALFAPFAIPNTFAEVPRDQLPLSLSNSFTKYYRRTDAASKTKDYLLVRVYPNTKFTSLEQFSTEQVAGFNVYDRRVYKRDGYFAEDILFTSNEKKFLNQYTIVYVPGFFHVVGFASELTPTDTQSVVQAKLASFINDFLSYYDITAASNSSAFNDGVAESNVLLENEKYFQLKGAK